MASRLPGFNAELRDGGLTLTDDGHAFTESILLLGTAIDGPVRTPVTVRRIEDAESMFGKISEFGVGNGATLLRGLHEAWRAGGRNIRLMRIAGSEASSKITGPTTKTNIVRSAHETLGITSGNMEFTFEVANSPVYADQVTVYANGSEVAENFLTIDEENGKITIAANAVDGESEIQVRYTYKKVTEHIVTDEMLVSNDGLSFISQNGYVDWDEESVTVYVDGMEVEKSAYGIDAVSGVVTFNEEMEESTITADFTYRVSEDQTVTESTYGTGEDSKKWVAEGRADVFDLRYQPMAASMVVYVNGVVAPGDAFTVHTNEKKLIVKPGHLSTKATITVAYSYNGSQTETPTINLRSVYGGRLYNRLAVSVEDVTDRTDTVVGKKVVITKPVEKRGSIDERPLEYSSVDFPTFNALVNAINTDASNNVVVAETDSPGTRTIDLLLQPSTSFSGGDDGLGLSKDAIYRILEGEVDENGDKVEAGIYDLLQNYSVDNIVLLDGFADDVLGSDLDNFAYQLARHCAVASAQNNETYGWIGTKPIDSADLAEVNKYVRRLTEDNSNIYTLRNKNGIEILDSNGGVIDIGRHISVIAGPDFVFSHRELGRYYANGAAAIAGFVSSLSPQSAPTNKTIPGVEGLRYTLSPAQLDRLSTAQYMTARTKYGRGVVVTDGLTAAIRGSDFARVSTMRITNAAVAIVRDESEAYIGEPNEIENRNAMASAIQVGLDSMKAAGALTDFEFAIHASTQDQLLGRATVELRLVPAFELRQITTVVSLTPALG